jgi:TonB family protein
MNPHFRVAVPAAAIVLVFAQAPALAQYANEFTPAKLIAQGKLTSATIAGNGTVVVQVQVNADGTHKAIRVIHSTNAADNAAAMEISQNSTYRPAHRGTTPVVSFYDFTLRFSGKSVANAAQGSGIAPGSMSPAASQVVALIRAGQYQQAVSKAESELLSSPSDDSLREALGLAAYRAGDYAKAASAFNALGSVSGQFKPVAADALAHAATDAASTNPTQALAYAQKAVSLESNGDTNFALGVVQLAANDPASAVATLKLARDQAASDPKMPKALKVNIDSELVQAYMANHDIADAQATVAQIKQLDPTSTEGSRAMAAGLYNEAVAVAKTDLNAALTDLDQAAAAGDPQTAVTANTEAALLIGNSPKPDYKRMQAYAEKALAVSPNDDKANYLEGVALTGQGMKKQAQAALEKADQEAKAAGDDALSLTIESFIKKNISDQPGGGG